jgi:hypothetical protein
MASPIVGANITTGTFNSVTTQLLSNWGCSIREWVAVKLCIETSSYIPAAVLRVCVMCKDRP